MRAPMLSILLAISLRNATSLPHTHRPPEYGHARWLPPALPQRDGTSVGMAA